MKIYFTENSGTRLLQECNLYEIRLLDRVADDGIEQKSVYRIYNKDYTESFAISFGGNIDVGESLRNAFWNDIANTLKQNASLFDVDKWFDDIVFVTPSGQRLNGKQGRK